MAEKTTTHTDRTLSDLVSQIAQAQNMITYYENVIMRKEIAIQEIINGHLASQITTEDVRNETIKKRYL